MFRFRHHGRRKMTPENGSVILTRLGDGQRARVVQILGGEGIYNRLAALGIREGQKVTRVGGMFLRGPVTVQVDKTQVAIGFGMAMKILVEPEHENPVNGQP